MQPRQATRDVEDIANQAFNLALPHREQELESLDAIVAGDREEHGEGNSIQGQVSEAVGEQDTSTEGSQGNTLEERSVIHNMMAEAVDSLVGGLDALRVLHNATEENRFATEPSNLIFGRPATAALGVEHYMCVPREVVLQGLIEGTAAIAQEVTAGGTDDDRECLHYILHAEAGSSEQTYQGGLKRDCDERGRVLACRTVTDSSGGVRGMRLEDFVSHPSAQLANLTEAHVVALRLYTTQAFKSINNPLRDRERFESGEAHPLPATVALIRDALGKLRAVEADHSRDSALRRVYLYRGMKDVMEQGGTELAPMSTTSNLSVAMQYSASVRAVLLRLITESFYERGPDISFLSAFPGEAEFLFPPLTYLQPTGDVETVTVDGLAYEVVDVRPRF